MASVTKFSGTGAKSGNANLDDHTFGIEPNIAVMHQVVTNQLATRRAGTQSTKTRSEVRGGGAKPYRQKGTGNARQGSIRAPHYVGGGVALGPKPRKYGKKTPKKMINLALRSALSDRFADGKVIVVESWSFDKPSTRAAVELLDKLGVDDTVLVVVGRDDANVVLSMRNLWNVQLCEPQELNAYDVLVNTYVVFAEADLPTFDGSAKAGAKAEKADAKAGKADAKADKADAKADKADAKADKADAKADKADAKADKADAKADKADAKADKADAKADKADASDAESAADAPQAFAATETATSDSADAGEFAEGEWPGSVLPDADGNGPDSHQIKGNASSMLYHVPGSSFYKRTKAEVWFDTEDNAKAAGFQKPPSQRDESDES